MRYPQFDSLSCTRHDLNRYIWSLFRNNFLQVDIFYQELSHRVIEQNVAFEFLSLLSEIGGFLGLLLGASVLTVCELMDYITLLIFRKLNRKIAS